MRSVFLLVPLLLFACKSGESSFDVFGSELASSEIKVVPVPDLVRNLSEYEGKTVRVSGEVISTCAKKGCWMYVGKQPDQVFVRFKDYAFFVPTAGAEGRPVVFEGVVTHKEMGVEEQRHYAEDAGDIEGAKKITEPKMIPFVMATGVRMYDKPSTK